MDPDLQPPCQICAETGAAGAGRMLAFVGISYGGSKVQRWMVVCEQHYNGGPVKLLTEVPAFLMPKKDEPRK